jgi:enoyl-CoA hydratase/carnithine racemase
VEPLPLARFVELASSVVGREALAAHVQADGAVLVGLGRCDAPVSLAALPLVVVGVGADDAAGAELADVVVPDAATAREVLAGVARTPRAAVALALLLRGAEERSVPAGLVAESATYSALQAGPEHQAWLSARDRGRGRRREQPAAPPVRVERHGEVLRVTLDRPDVRNALDARMRDALLDALAVAEAEPALAVELAGAGAGFCSGGDLDEFGTLDDPASAHRLRLARSVGLVLAGLADRTTAVVHGASAGSGVELAAFAGRVVATPDATFELPELSMGLVPGAGGTVSVTARIGRHRCAWLALTGERIDAPTALAWGLVDAVDQDHPAPDLEGTRG